MSRCFPYPPPGYTLSKASNDPLIESIKLQKEKKKTKAEKKERRREKKEKKEKKEEKKLKKNGNEEMIQRKKDMSISHEVYGIIQKDGKEETSQWERSGITEEHGLPCNSQDPSNSSDSTQNSNKRKRHESPINGNNNILRFRLPSQKHMDCKTSGGEVELQRTCGRIDPSNKNDNAGASRAQLNKLPCVSMPSNSITVGLLPDESSKAPSQSASQNNDKLKEKRHDHSKTISEVEFEQISGRIDDAGTSRVQLNKPPTVSMPSNSTIVELLHGESSKAPSQSASTEKHHEHVSKKCKKQHKAAKKYAKLIDHIPLRQADETMDYEEEWLCSKNPPPELEVKVQTHNQMMSCASTSMMWPCAQYQHDADLYVLPYSVPF